ncbi:hypothetical protein D3C72_777960 [compost metagenome]
MQEAWRGGAALVEQPAGNATLSAFAGQDQQFPADRHVETIRPEIAQARSVIEMTMVGAAPLRRPGLHPVLGVRIGFGRDAPDPVPVRARRHADVEFLQQPGVMAVKILIHHPAPEVGPVLFIGVLKILVADKVAETEAAVRGRPAVECLHLDLGPAKGVGHRVPGHATQELPDVGPVLSLARLDGLRLQEPVPVGFGGVPEVEAILKDFPDRLACKQKGVGEAQQALGVA